MNRYALLATVAVTVLGGGAAAANRPTDRPVPLLAAGASSHDDTTTTAPPTARREADRRAPSTTAIERASTTTSTSTEPTPPKPNRTETDRPKPARPEPDRPEPDRPESTTTTVAPAGIRLVCVSPGAERQGDVVCEWGDVPERTAKLVLHRGTPDTRGEPIWRTDDLRIHRLVDTEAAPGVRNAYRLTAHAADGTVIGVSEQAVVTPTAREDARPAAVRLACVSPGAERPGDVVCEWGDVPERTAYVVLHRGVGDERPESIWRTDDLSVHRHVDTDATPGVRNAYGLTAHAADGSVVGTSEKVVVTPAAPDDARPTGIELWCGTPAGGGGPRSSVVCEWEGQPDGTASWVVMREHDGPSQPIWRTDDTSVRRYVDTTSEPGVSYAYRVSAYAADGTFLGTSNPVRLTAGGEGADS